MLCYFLHIKLWFCLGKLFIILLFFILKYLFFCEVEFYTNGPNVYGAIYGGVLVFGEFD